MATERERSPLRAGLLGGAAGAAAAAAQVISLMWVHTTANHNHATGMSMSQSVRFLYAEGGVRRFYRGLAPAMSLAVLCRFGDVTANVVALQSCPDADLSLPTRTAAASCMAASWRVFLTPLDTVKKNMQVGGTAGISVVRAKFRNHGVPALYQGAVASYIYSIVAHFGWFYTFNLLSVSIPRRPTERGDAVRNGFIGFCSSVVSISVSNGIRVVQTVKQTSHGLLTYRGAIAAVVSQGGVLGLFSRGLQARIVAYGLQGSVFASLWKYMEHRLAQV